MLVHIENDGDLFGECQSDGDDILFTMNGDNETKLSHEIEYWNWDTGNSQVDADIWVNVTSVSSSADTVIWMYYGNASASNQEDISGTWNSGYEIVYHMDGTDNTFDSAGADNTGINSGSTSQTGKIGDARAFDGSNDLISITNWGSEEDVTIELWGEDDDWSSTPDEERFFYRSQYWGLLIETDTPYNSYIQTNVDAVTTGKVYYDASGFTDNTYYHLIMAYEVGGYQSLYVNGDRVQYVDASTGSPDGGIKDGYIGAHPNPKEFLQGGIDEFRLHNVNRSQDYYKLSYESQELPTGFLAIDSEQEYGGGWTNSNPTTHLDSPGNGATGISKQPTCQIDANDIDASNQSINVTWQFYDTDHWYNFGYNQSNSNMSNIQQILTNASAADTTYQWRVVVHDNATPPGYATNITWSFITESDPTWHSSSFGGSVTVTLAIDVELNDSSWMAGSLDCGVDTQKNFTFYQNGTATIDITLGINSTNGNYSFVNYTTWSNNGHDQYCANFTTDVWSSESMIEPDYPATSVLKSSFAPGNFAFGIRLWMPKSVTYQDRQEDFEVVLYVSEST